MFTIYTPGELIAVVESLENPPITFFRDRYFPFERQSDTDVILFDVVDKYRTLAPYVSPLVEGKVMEQNGYSTRSLRPPYVKPKHTVDPNDQFTRRAGEPIGAPMSPAQRRDAQIREKLLKQDESITMLEEVQCSEALRLGKITIAGPGYAPIANPIVLNFGRHVDLTVALAGDDRWGQANEAPLANIQAWARRIRDNGGGVASQVTMGLNAWALFLASLTESEKEMLFNSLRGSESRVELGPRLAEKVQFQGRIGEFDFWTYSDAYQDEDGNSVDIMPTNAVVMSGSAVEGTRCYAAVRDARAGMQALRRFPKMWMQEDPSAEFLMTQSSFLMVPLRPNATLGATVA